MRGAKLRARRIPVFLQSAESLHLLTELTPWPQCALPKRRPNGAKEYSPGQGAQRRRPGYNPQDTSSPEGAKERDVLAKHRSITSALLSNGVAVAVMKILVSAVA
jgi:hypothetical protein